MATLLFALACSGDDKSGAPTFTPEPSPTPFVDLPHSQPITLTPVKPNFEGFEPPTVYSLREGLLAPGSAEYAAARRATGSWRIEDFEETRTDTRVGIYDPRSDSWRAFDLGAPAQDKRISDDGSHAAVEVRNGPLVLLDLLAGTRQDIPLEAFPRGFSPDGRLLLIGLRDEWKIEAGLSRWFVLDVADPRRAIRLPLGKADGPNEQMTPIWLSNTLLLSRTQNNTVLQLIALSGPDASITLEEPVPSDQIVISADNSTIGVQERLDKGTGRPGITAYDYNIKVYSLRPFRLVATLPGAAMGYQLEQPSQPPDDTRFLAVLDLCIDGKSRLVLFHLRDGSQTELARGKIMQYVFSPDGRWVAYTTWPGDAYVVPADGSAPPRLVTHDIAPPTPPVWSADSRYVSFNSFFGGGDYCI
jgi:hypothetical protein